MIKKNILLLALLFVTVPTVSWSMDMMGNEEIMEHGEHANDQQHIDAERNAERERMEEAGMPKKKPTLRERARSWWGRGSKKPAKAPEAMQNSSGDVSSFGTGSDTESASTANTIMNDSLEQGNRLDSLFAKREGARNSFWNATASTDSDRNVMKSNFNDANNELENHARSIVESKNPGEPVRDRAQNILDNMGDEDGLEGSRHIDNDSEGKNNGFNLPDNLDSTTRKNFLEGIVNDDGSRGVDHLDKEQAQRMLEQERVKRIREEEGRIKAEQETATRVQREAEEAQRKEEEIRLNYEKWKAENRRIDREIAAQNRQLLEQKNRERQAEEARRAALRGAPRTRSTSEMNSLMSSDRQSNIDQWRKDNPDSVRRATEHQSRRYNNSKGRFGFFR